VSQAKHYNYAMHRKSWKARAGKYHDELGGRHTKCGKLPSEVMRGALREHVKLDLHRHIEWRVI